jgi:hypothetical protein
MTPPLRPPFCVICNRPIEDDNLKYGDKDGNLVHDACYAEQLTKQEKASSGRAQSKFDCVA